MVEGREGRIEGQAWFQSNREAEEACHSEPGEEPLPRQVVSNAWLVMPRRDVRRKLPQGIVESLASAVCGAGEIPRQARNDRIVVL